MELNIDISQIHDVRTLNKYYRRASMYLDTIAEELQFDVELDEQEAKAKIENIEKLMYQLRLRFYEIQEPELTDGTIDLYRVQNTYFTITEHNHKIPIGDIEYVKGKRAVPGNISYEIFEEYRGHHYALRALRLIGHLLLDKGINRIFITASNKTNYPSIRTIEEFGGERFHKEDYTVGPIPYTCDLSKIYSK